MADDDELRRSIFLALEKHAVPALFQATPQKTGDIAASWAVREGNNKGEWIIYNPNGIVLNSLEFGSKPHVIEAKNKKFLRFKKPNSPPKNKRKLPGNQAFEKDGYIFAKKVWHPGIEAMGFIQGVIENRSLWQEVEKEIEEHLKKSMK